MPSPEALAGEPLVVGKNRVGQRQRGHERATRVTKFTGADALRKT